MSTHVLLSSFTPSTMAPEVLEAIFVKRAPLAERMVESLVAAVTDGDIEHHLVVGPRGMGKTHLLAIVVNRLRERGLGGNALAIAWLREEEWGITEVGELYEQMLLKLADDASADEALRSSARQAADDLATVDPANLADSAEAHLTRVLAGRRLVVVVENLDDVFGSIGEDDQHRLRAYLQNQRNLALLASSPSLAPSIATREGLFWGFFAIHHLDELDVDEARELLLRIAGLHDDEDSRRLRRYLTTDEATTRLKVVARIAGGHPRLWVLMSECITTERLDEIVSLLHALLDDLTPYYQSQMASLSGHQRKVVTVVARAGGGLLVKDVAARARLAPNAAAKHIGDLVKLGFVRPAVLPEGVEMADGRSKAYELREPLLRHSFELKENRGEPLRVIVDFLKAWYEPEDLQHWAREAAGHARRCAEAALARIAEEAEAVGELLSALRELKDLVDAGRVEEALPLADELLDVVPELWDLYFTRGCLRVQRGDDEGALSDFEITPREPDFVRLALTMGVACLLRLGRPEEALERILGSGGRATLAMSPGDLQLAGEAYLRTHRPAEALDAFDLALAAWSATGAGAHDGAARAAFHDGRRRALAALGRLDDAVAAAESAVEADDRTGLRRALHLARLHRAGRAPTDDELRTVLAGSDPSGSIDEDALLDLFCTAVVALDQEQALITLERTLELRSDEPGWVHLAGTAAIVALMTDDLVGASPDARVAWLEALAAAADRTASDSPVTAWAGALARYERSGDGAELLDLPPEVRTLFDPRPSAVAIGPDG
jgi:tetratricopeptide (TPR) repeat protein